MLFSLIQQIVIILAPILKINMYTSLLINSLNTDEYQSTRVPE